MVHSPGRNGRMDAGSHAYGQASLGFQSGRTAGSFRGHGQCTPCPARNAPSPCLLFPSIWSWLQCHLPREAWPGHPRKSTSIITLFSLLGPVTSFSKFVCVCVCFFAGENCRPFVGRHCTFLVIWHIHCPTQSAPDTRAARLREDLLSQRI